MHLMLDKGRTVGRAGEKLLICCRVRPAGSTVKNGATLENRHRACPVACRQCGWSCLNLCLISLIIDIFKLIKACPLGAQAQLSLTRDGEVGYTVPRGFLCPILTIFSIFVLLLNCVEQFISIKIHTSFQKKGEEEICNEKVDEIIKSLY